MRPISWIQRLIAKRLPTARHDVGIDLGTANTLVYVPGKGVIINEPSVVAVNQKTGRVVAVGTEAKQMLGRTPAHLAAVRPLVDGVISDFEVAEEMLAYLLAKAERVAGGKFVGPRVVVGVPSGVTNVETRAVFDAAMNAGAREVFVVEEPMAAAIGVKLPVQEPVGSMIVDIGGGTTDIAVISLGGIVRSKNLKVAGDRFNADIAAYVRNEFKILVGERTAEDVKVAVGSVLPGDGPVETTIRGRDLVSGLPREVVVTDADVREALAQSVETLVAATRQVLEVTPPEIVADVMRRGVFLVGGGALLRGLDRLLADELEIPVFVAPEPLTAVARGTGVILENIEAFRDVLVSHDDDGPSAK